MLGAVIFLYAKHVRVVYVLGDLLVLELHFMNVLTDFVHSPSESLVHLFVPVIGPHADPYLLV